MFYRVCPESVVKVTHPLHGLVRVLEERQPERDVTVHFVSASVHLIEPSSSDGRRLRLAYPLADVRNFEGEIRRGYPTRAHDGSRRGRGLGLSYEPNRGVRPLVSELSDKIWQGEKRNVLRTSLVRSIRLPLHLQRQARPIRQIEQRPDRDRLHELGVRRCHLLEALYGTQQGVALTRDDLTIRRMHFMRDGCGRDCDETIDRTGLDEGVKQC